MALAMQMQKMSGINILKGKSQSMSSRIACLSLLLFLLSCSHKKPVKIGLQPYGNFDEEVVRDLSIALNNTYGLKIYILNSKPIPKQAFVNVKSPRYRADVILGILKKEKADTIDYIIAVTDKDISTTKRDTEGNIKKPESKYKDWGVFGLGYRPGPSCIISSFRLKNTSP
jgi:archaemetzincin